MIFRQKDHETMSVITQLYLNAFTYISKYTSAREMIHAYSRRNMQIHLCKNGNTKLAFSFLKNFSEELVNMKYGYNENVKFC